MLSEIVEMTNIKINVLECTVHRGLKKGLVALMT